MRDLLKDNKFNIFNLSHNYHMQAVVILLVSLVCRGGLLFLEGIWWDDWAWVWHYYGSDSFDDFIFPFKSLGHQFVGLIFYLDMKVLDIFPFRTNNIWHISAFIIITANGYLLWVIGRKICFKESLLPLMVSIFYIASPVITNNCEIMKPYQIILLFYLLSVLFTAHALLSREHNYKYAAMAMIFCLLSFTGLESFILFEISRLFIIYVILRQNAEQFRGIISKAFLHWLPFAIIALFVAIYVLFFQEKIGPYKGEYALPELNMKALDDVLNNYRLSLRYIFRIWENIYDNFLVPTVKQNILLSVFIVGTVFVLTYPRELIKGSRWKEVVIGLLLGYSLIIIGLTPYALTRGYLTMSVESRHGLLANVGVSIFLASLVLMFYHSRVIINIFFSIILFIFISCGALFNNYVIDSYRDDWQLQRSFWWAFTRRVPDLADGTYLIADMPRRSIFIGDWRGSYEFSAPLNLLYAKSREKKEINNHFAETFRNAIDAKSEYSWIRNLSKDEGEFLSFKGVQKYYPKKLLITDFPNGNLLLNEEIRISSTTGIYMEQFTLKTNPSQIIYNSNNRVFPLRKVMGADF